MRPLSEGSPPNKSCRERIFGIARGEGVVASDVRHLDMKCPGNILLGLYRIEGDTKTICFNEKP
jgi:hypothetical protein